MKAVINAHPHDIKFFNKNDNKINFYAYNYHTYLELKKTIPKIFFEGRFQYLNKGKIKNKIFKNEKIMLDGAHAETDAINMADFLKKIKEPKYAIWAMMKI